MIPLDKNPSLKPIGVGEVLRRIAGNAVMMLCQKDIIKTAGSLQLNAGQDAGAETAIHAMRDIFVDVVVDALLLIDSENAFSSINFEVILLNFEFICPIISIHIVSFYATPWTQKL